MRVPVRITLVALALVAVGISVWFARGRWLVNTLEKKGPDQTSWHAILDYNSLDSETHHLRGQPKGVWRVTDSSGSIVWVMTKHNVLSAISPDGKVQDLGGVVCNGNPTPLWKGTTPDGQTGIVLVSKGGSLDEDNYVMFVTFDGRSDVRLIVEITSDSFEASVSEVDGWPMVRLADKDEMNVAHFSFPECTLPMVTTQSEEGDFWNLIQFD